MAIYQNQDINFDSQLGMNYQKYDYQYYKMGTDVLMYFSTKDSEEPAMDVKTLEGISYLVTAFWEKKKICDSVHCVRLDKANKNERRIYYDLEWSNFDRLGQTTVEDAMIEFISNFENSADTIIEEGMIVFNVSTSKITMSEEFYQQTKQKLLEFLQDVKNNNKIKWLDSVYISD